MKPDSKRKKEIQKIRLKCFTLSLSSLELIHYPTKK